jgi:hypothetical protein
VQAIKNLIDNLFVLSLSFLTGNITQIPMPGIPQTLQKLNANHFQREPTANPERVRLRM